MAASCLRRLVLNKKRKLGTSPKQILQCTWTPHETSFQKALSGHWNCDMEKMKVMQACPTELNDETDYYHKIQELGESSINLMRLELLYRAMQRKCNA